MTDNEILNLVDEAIANKTHILVEAQTDLQAISVLHRISDLLSNERPSIKIFTSPVTGSIDTPNTDIPIASNNPRKINMPGLGDIFISEKIIGKHPEISPSMKGATIITTSISPRHGTDALIRSAEKLELIFRD